MPEYVLNRNHTLVSLCGRTFSFKKGEPLWVTPEAEKEALMIGAVPVEGPKDILEPEQEPVQELSAEERAEAINKAYDTLKARNARGDFTAQGVPNVAAIKALTGFEVQSKERDATWQAYREAALAAAENE